MDELDIHLNNELKYRSKHCRLLGRANYYSAYLVIIVGIVANIFATFFVATDNIPKRYIALLTAAPGILLLLNRTLKFEDKARWYWKHMQYLDGLSRAIEYEGQQADAISQKLTETDKQMDAEWPGFGKIPSPLESTDTK